MGDPLGDCPGNPPWCQVVIVVLGQGDEGARHLAAVRRQLLPEQGERQIAAGGPSFGEPGIGLADASLVVLAARAATRSLLTLDERHFRAVRPQQGGAFRLLPADG